MAQDAILRCDTISVEKSGSKQKQADLEKEAGLFIVPNEATITSCHK
jgi:hypothetical protein